MTALHFGRVSTMPDGGQRIDRSTEPFTRITALIVQVAVVAVGFDYKLSKGITVGLALAAITAPIWLPLMRRYSMATTILVIGVACLPWGYLLSERTAISHALNETLRFNFFALMLSGLATIAVLLWARQLFPLYHVVLLYGLGSLADAMLFTERSFKFNLAIPVAFVVLGLVERFRNRVIAAGSIMAVGIIGVLDEGRSLFGFCLIAAALTLWQIRPRGSSRTKANRWAPVLLMLVLCFGIYSIASSLLSSGVFGSALQDRTNNQINTSGNLLVGGRPEWAATRELIQLRPSGYGAGIVPSWADLQAGTAGLASINVDAGGYTTNYLFGGAIELHSVAADLWAHFGWMGALLAIIMLVALVRSMSTLVAEHRAATSVLFGCSLAIWYLCFGPIYSNWIDVCAALGISLLARAAPPSDGPVAATPADQGARGEIRTHTPHRGRGV